MICVFYAHANPLHLTFTLLFVLLFLIRVVSCEGVCKITGCNHRFIGLNDEHGECVVAFFKNITLGNMLFVCHYA